MTISVAQAVSLRTGSRKLTARATLKANKKARAVESNVGLSHFQGRNGYCTVMAVSSTTNEVCKLLSSLAVKKS